MLQNRKGRRRKKKIFFPLVFFYFFRVSCHTVTIGICVKLEETYDFIINKKPNLVQVGTKGTASPFPNEMLNLERDASQLARPQNPAADAICTSSFLAEQRSGTGFSSFGQPVTLQGRGGLTTGTSRKERSRNPRPRQSQPTTTTTRGKVRFHLWRNGDME